MIIAVANQKGGVGKTTTTAALAFNLAKLGYNVLAVDVDPQASLTATLGIDEETAARNPNLFTVVERMHPLGAAMIEVSPRLHLVPSHIALAHSERRLQAQMDRERILRRLLEPVLPSYDVVLLDSPPSLGLFAYNCLGACDTVLAPIQCEPLAMDGLTMLLETLAEVREAGLNPKCELGGAVLTMYDTRRNVDKRVVATLQSGLGDLAIGTIIPRDVRLVEMTERGDVSVLDGESAGAVAYRKLAQEVAKRWLTS